MAVRVADAMRRGARATEASTSCAPTGSPWPTAPSRRCATSFGVTPKSPGAGAAGSVGPWEVGGISPFQVAAGRALSEPLGRPYEPYGARAAVGDGEPVTGN